MSAEIAGSYMPTRPEVGRVYWAPVANCSPAVPLVFGERWGVIVDGESQDVAVVYSSRELAETAIANPAIWHAGNVARVTVRAIRCVSERGRRFEWADIAA